MRKQLLKLPLVSLWKDSKSPGHASRHQICFASAQVRGTFTPGSVPTKSVALVVVSPLRHVHKGHLVELVRWPLSIPAISAVEATQVDGRPSIGRCKWRRVTGVAAAPGGDWGVVGPL